MFSFGILAIQNTLAAIGHIVPAIRQLWPINVFIFRLKYADQSSSELTFVHVICKNRKNSTHVMLKTCMSFDNSEVEFIVDLPDTIQHKNIGTIDWVFNQEGVTII